NNCIRQYDESKRRSFGIENISLIFPNALHTPKNPPESLLYEVLNIVRGFRVSNCFRFINNALTASQNSQCKILVFNQCILAIPPIINYVRLTPCPHWSGNYTYRIYSTEYCFIEVLRNH